MSHRRFLFRFYLPLFVGVGLVLAVLLMNVHTITGAGTAQLSFSFLGIGISLPVPISLMGSAFAKSILLVGAGLTICVALNVDFSKYFPNLLQMDVYFDLEELGNALKQFTDREYVALRISPRWRELTELYDLEMRTSLQALSKKLQGGTGSVRPELVTRSTLHAHGATTFVVERVGLFRYHIVESLGYLEYTVDVPRVGTFHFRTDFELRSTGYDYIQPSIAEIQTDLLHERENSCIRPHDYWRYEDWSISFSIYRFNAIPLGAARRKRDSPGCVRAISP